ncbi:Vps62-related protein, partial [Bacillus cereus]|uniref:FG-GAP repeat domain-containing protein n=1 Tax=Bacillus cereus TaxID=1396 RepID=UPI002AC0DCCE
MWDSLEKIIYTLKNPISSKEKILNRDLVDEETLLKRFAPILYLHSEEKSWPSSIDWYLQRTRLVDETNKVIYEPVGDVSKLDNEIFKSSPFRLEIMDERTRLGVNPTQYNVPIYATINKFTTDTYTSYYQLKYYYFFPFNGNICNLQKVRTLLKEGIMVAEALTLLGIVFLGMSWFFVPFGALALAEGILLLAYFNSIIGLGMHEGDWEHISVIVPEKNNTQIAAIYYAAHTGGEWVLPDGSTDPYTRTRFSTENGRPVVYIAKESHASYPVARCYPRYLEVANDYTNKGFRWDTQNNIINMNDGNQNWKDCKLSWGCAAKKPIPELSVTHFFLHESEYNNGPSMPLWNGLQSGSDLYIRNNPELSDAVNWGRPEYYKTIQCADIDGDGSAELLARGKRGLLGWKYDSNLGDWVDLPTLETLNDSGGWNQPQYYSTIQFADIDGDRSVELLARSPSGLLVWKYDSNSKSWNRLPSLGALNDSGGWDHEKYYSTIQCADIDGDGIVELLARSASGLWVWKYDSNSKIWNRLPSLEALNDSGGWDYEKYYSTIQCADIDGDGIAEVLARSASGLWVWKYDSNSKSWNRLPSLEALNDSGGWDDEKYYSTIQCADI